jgi:pimeloyl-ACP methyl ester carboxylesterase
MVDDLIEFIDDHNMDSVNLIGHSMGGKVAMHFALNHPEKVQSLTVLDIGIKYYPPRHDYIFNALCAIDLSLFTSRNQIDEYLSGQIQSFGIRQFLIKNIRRDDQSGYTWKMNLPDWISKASRHLWKRMSPSERSVKTLRRLAPGWKSTARRRGLPPKNSIMPER